MPKKQNQKIKQKKRKFAQREAAMFASFENWSLPKKDTIKPDKPVEVSPAVIGSLKTITKKSTKKKNIRNKKRREQAIERAIAKDEVLQQKLAQSEQKTQTKSKAKTAW
mmetsp:Transcript_32359/g.55393  ORF Transcript_32359/g.55393 Transcript_32359/m.55393 type:complete len:109 (+) Transcript_32359:31-357(+)